MEESELRVNAHLFVPQQTLNSIMTKPLCNSDLTHGMDPSLTLDNHNQSNLDLLQNSGSSSVLNHDLTQLQSTQSIGDSNLVCPEISAHSDIFIDSKLTTIDETSAGISRSQPNFNETEDNGCVISPFQFLSATEGE